MTSVGLSRLPSTPCLKKYLQGCTTRWHAKEQDHHRAKHALSTGKVGGHMVKAQLPGPTSDTACALFAALLHTPQDNPLHQQLAMPFLCRLQAQGTYSAACLRAGMLVDTLCRSRCEMASTSGWTIEKGSTFACWTELELAWAHACSQQSWCTPCSDSVAERTHKKASADATDRYRKAQQMPCLPARCSGAAQPCGASC